ncbi:peptidoglycan-binding protein [Aliisedimentitalea scapharcae]|uniref:Peptidoglycan-binding protein n=1 Tax=Aliisedimentitalea scapharcae TaxID=1524259 RepID=A0ABZ2XMX1_9RHOB
MFRSLKQAFLGLVIMALAIGTSPESVIRLAPSADWAEARGGHGRAGGFSGGGARSRPSGGARSRPATSRPSNRATRPATSRPSTRPATSRPSTRPAQARPAPSRPSAGTRPNRPEAGTRPSNRPAGARPPGSRPPGSRPPGAAHRPGARPPGHRPPGTRPPGVRPPIHRPPGYRPPGYRPPGYRPPYYRPPYYRPPHSHWGPYHYNPSWGWFFTAAIVGSTLVYASNLPEDQDCQKVQDGGETLYQCDGVLYRSTYYQDEQVYEIVSDAPGEKTAEPTSVIGLSLTEPMTRGAVVRSLQMALTEAGYDTGGTDGVFGSGTETALQWFQYDYELEPTGFVDQMTAYKLGLAEAPPEAAEPTTPAPAPAPATPETPTTVEEPAAVEDPTPAQD